MRPDDPRRRNLIKKRIKPGEIRNPKGVNGQDWLTEMRKFFGKEQVEDLTDIKRKKKCNRLRNVFAAAYKHALLGDGSAQRLIVETMCGRAKESVDLTSGGGVLGGGASVILYLPDDGSGEGEPNDDELDPPPAAPTG